MQGCVGDRLPMQTHRRDPEVVSNTSTELKHNWPINEDNQKEISIQREQTIS